MAKDKKKPKRNVPEKKQENPTPDIGKQDANVNEEGFCTMVQDGEMARPNSGDPCDDGR